MFKIHFGHLLGFSSIILAICSGFFSVIGLSMLFAGANISVIIMASALELSKVITASFLHKYWGDISKTLRIYLTVGVIILVSITSAGIYGFLSSAYQKTASNLELYDSKINILDSKINQFQNKLNSNKLLIETRNKRVDQLNNQDISTGKSNRGNRNEIKEVNSNIDFLNVENSKLIDSIGKYNSIKSESTINSKVAGEVGPLKYLSKLTGKPMDVVVNYFILLLIFVFDPLAIALIIATTWVFEKEKKKKEFNESLDSEIKEYPKTDEKEVIEEQTIQNDKTNVIQTQQNTIEKERVDIEKVKERERGFSVEIPSAKNGYTRVPKRDNNSITKI
jgi:hypothetical protein